MATENIKNELFEKLNSKNLPLKNNTTFTDSFYPENNPQSNKNNKINEYKSMVPEKKTRPLSYKKIKISHLKNLEPQEKLVLNFINRVIRNKSKNKRNESVDYITSRKHSQKNSLKIKNQRQPQTFFGIKKLIINESIKNAYKNFADTSKFRDLSKETNEDTNCTFINEKGGYIFNQRNKKNNTEHNKLIQNFISSNIKYKKMYENLKKENENLNVKIQQLEDELEIMREEDKLNKEQLQENDEKIKEISALIKQQINNFDQKIFNYKELLLKKDAEIQKLNKEITKKDFNSKNSLDELKKIITNYEKIISNQIEVSNGGNNKKFNENNSVLIKNEQNNVIINKDINNINNKGNEDIIKGTNSINK